MALALQDCIGPAINEPGAYGLVHANISFDTSPTPPRGSYWIKMINTGIGINSSLPHGAAAADAIGWAIFYFRLETSLATNDIIPILRAQTNGTTPRDFFRLEGIWQSGGGYKMRIANNTPTVLVTGTTVFSVDTTYRIAWKFDGTNTVVNVDGVQQLTVAATEKLLAEKPVYNVLASSVNMTRKWCLLAKVTGAVAGDLTGEHVEVLLHDPAGAGTHADYTGTGCTGSPSYTYWDDWLNGGVSNGDTDYNCGPNAAAPKQSSTLTSKTYDQTVLGAKVIIVLKSNDAAKSVPNSGLMREGGTTTTVAVGDITTTSYVARAAIYPTPPGGGSWTAAKLNAAEAGHSRGSMVANLSVTALAVEGCAIGNVAPPAVSADRRRLLAQVA